MLATLAKVSRAEKDYDKAIFYLNKCYKLQKTFKIMLGSAAHNYIKLYIEIDQKETAARWFKIYVEELLSTKYDYQSNPYFEKIKLEVDPEDQKIMRKNVAINHR